MKVKISNPRGGAVDYVSQQLRVNLPGYASNILVELPTSTSEQWVAQFKKDGLLVESVGESISEPKPKALDPQSSPVVEKAQEALSEPKSGSKFTPASKKNTTSTSKK